MSYLHHLACELPVLSRPDIQATVRQQAGVTLASGFQFHIHGTHNSCVNETYQRKGRYGLQVASCISI